MNYFLPFLNAVILFTVIDMSNPLNKGYNKILDCLDNLDRFKFFSLLIKLLICGFCLSGWISLIEGLIFWDFWYIGYSWALTAICYGLIKKLYE